MQYIITPTEQFLKDVEFYVKKRKCKKLIEDIQTLEDKLKNGQFEGEEINGVGLPQGEVTYKLRMADTTHGLGKRGGFRVIYYVIKEDGEVFLLTIYHKRDQSNILPKEIIDLIEKYCI